ncbi:MAG: ubiquinol oxidase subunit II [Paracoccus sp. (in: a-proteobacteria)]|nr:ubiquinol oxidase subunit II [Paracoccus sp. (in: a-proteobacteria)]
MKRLHFTALLTIPAFLSACKPVVLSPAGDVAARQRDVLVTSTFLMLLIIIPVICLIVFFAWKYRASNDKATYAPDWSHSTKLELVIWAAPLLIIICLGGLTWVGTHLLDPYRKLDRISQDVVVTNDHKPLEVRVVSLDWKWLFFYPEYGIATVNELAAPVDRPIEFKLTSASVMNAFYIPTLAGMIYTMPGMETMLHGVINEEGVYEGFSSNYSGAGFSGMRFKFHALDEAGFDGWVQDVRAEDSALDHDAYLGLVKPTENVAPTYFGSYSDDLYHDILNMCTAPGQTCMDQMMMQDMQTKSEGMNMTADHDMGHMGHDMGHDAGTDDLQADTPEADKTATPADKHMLRGHGLGRDFMPLFLPEPVSSTPATK